MRFCVQISCAHDRAALVTDDAKALRTHIEAATGERIAALKRIGEMPRKVRLEAIETPQTGAGGGTPAVGARARGSSGTDLGL